jgi:VCBS repeat protein
MGGNNGDGTFTDLSVESGIAAHVGKGMGVAFADYNDDGWTNIFVANDTVPNFLFRNNGDGRLTEIGLRAGVAVNEDEVALSSMGADFRDIDNDGQPDLFLTALSNETFPHFINREGSFWDMTFQSSLGYLTLPSGEWVAGVFDLNNDGWKDIFTAGSHVMDNDELYSSRRSKQPNRGVREHGWRQVRRRFAKVGVAFPIPPWRFRLRGFQQRRPDRRRCVVSERQGRVTMESVGARVSLAPDQAPRASEQPGRNRSARAVDGQNRPSPAQSCNDFSWLRVLQHKARAFRPGSGVTRSGNRCALAERSVADTKRGGG